MQEKNKLNGNQRKAIAALLAYKTIGEAAQACGLNPSTIHRYFQDPAFMAALRAAEEAVLGNTTRRLLAMATKGLDGLESVLDDPGQRGAGNKRLAAVAILDHLVKLREYHDFEQRLTALEVGANERKN